MKPGAQKDPVKKMILIPCLSLWLLSAFVQDLQSACAYNNQIGELNNWLIKNRDQTTGLPYSHLGDERFENWVITYDSAVVTLAYIAQGRIDDARKIIDFYIETPNVWRLGGIIDAVNPANPVLGEDWSVRTGSNLWMGIAGFHLYKNTKEQRYLELAEKLAVFAIALQDNDEKDYNFGGIRLGPQGGPNVASDQHIDYDLNKPSFYDVFSTEHNIDAYALFSKLYQETKGVKYKEAKDRVLVWLKSVAYNKAEHRFNRGYSNKRIDAAVATDVHSWGISALGADTLDTFETGLAEKMIEFIEKNCVSIVLYTKPDGKKVEVKGADFIDYNTAAGLGRKPLVSPEWTFQLINAYKRLESDFKMRQDREKEIKYGGKKEELTENMLVLAIGSDNTLAFPYATQDQAIIGHEYKTPSKGNLSAIGAAYGILALSSFDPLVN